MHKSVLKYFKQGGHSLEATLVGQSDFFLWVSLDTYTIKQFKATVCSYSIIARASTMGYKFDTKITARSS